MFFKSADKTLAGKKPKKGADAELRAQQILKAKGLRPLAQNFSVRGGELDLVMLDGAHLVFVEVRYRNNSRFGSAAETVTPHKQDKLRLAAMHFIQQHAEHAERPMRFDVIALGPDSEEWIQDAFA